jgi:hypothetical protein
MSNRARAVMLPYFSNGQRKLGERGHEDGGGCNTHDSKLRARGRIALGRS